MRNILRDPGAEVIVGILSFAATFVAIGLALPAAAKEWAIPDYSRVAFIIAVLFLLGAIIATISLLRHFDKIRGHTRQIGCHLRQGYALRKEILERKLMMKEAVGTVTQWENNVQQWLDHNLPDYAPDFSLETITSTTAFVYYNKLNEETSSAVQRLESKLSSLREILRDIRR